MEKLKQAVETILKGKALRRALATLLTLGWAALAHADGYTPEQYYAAGYNSYQVKQYTQSIAYVKAAIQLNPAYEAAYQLAGNCYYALGDNTDALAYYMKASTLSPGNTQLAQLILSLQAQMGGIPPVNTQVNTQFNTTTTTQTVSTGDNDAVAFPSEGDDPDADDSKHFDEAKSRMVKIHGPKHKAYLFDTTEARTLDHVYLTDNVRDVEFLTDAVGKAWRVILTQDDGTKLTYDQDGHFMLKSQS